MLTAIQRMLRTRPTFIMVRVAMPEAWGTSDNGERISDQAVSHLWREN